MFDIVNSLAAGLESLGFSIPERTSDNDGYWIIYSKDAMNFHWEVRGDKEFYKTIRFELLVKLSTECKYMHICLMKSLDELDLYVGRYGMNTVLKRIFQEEINEYSKELMKFMFDDKKK